jgi:hypothetical protein
MTIPARLALLLTMTALAVSSLYGSGEQDDRRIRIRERDRIVERSISTVQTASDDPCERSRRWEDDDYRSHCEVREEHLAAGPLSVDAGRNGGIRVRGWDQNETLVQAVIQTHARTEDRAKEIAGNVQIQVGGGAVRAGGPDLDRRESWSVSFHVSVPRRTDLMLNANNGGITIDGVSGDISFGTTNGGVHLTDLAGWVHGRTQNGGLHVELNGQRWDGNGLDVETTNGGVNLAIPQGYSAQLETRTVNGGFRTDYPITLQGELTTRRGVTTTLGSGGPPLRVRTTNGGVRITKR